MFQDNEGLLHPSFVPEDYESHLERVRGMEMRDDDVILAGYPKSGNHWLYEVTQMVLRQSPEFCPLTLGESTMDSPYYGSDVSTSLGGLSSPRVLVSHLRPHRLPSQLLEKRAKLIIILRNPKDIAVSLYPFLYHIQVFSPFKGSFDTFFQYFMQGEVAIGRWADHVASFERFTKDHPSHPFCVITYEGLKQNPSQEIRRLSEFLERPLSDDVIEAIAKRTRFDPMTVELLQGKLSYMKHIFSPGAPGLFRKGIVGDWRNTLTAQQSDDFDEMFKEEMRQSSLGALVLPYI